MTPHPSTAKIYPLFLPPPRPSHTSMRPRRLWRPLHHLRRWFVALSPLVRYALDKAVTADPNYNLPHYCPQPNTTIISRLHYLRRTIRRCTRPFLLYCQADVARALSQRWKQQRHCQHNADHRTHDVYSCLGYHHQHPVPSNNGSRLRHSFLRSEPRLQERCLVARAFILEIVNWGKARWVGRVGILQPAAVVLSQSPDSQ